MLKNSVFSLSLVGFLFANSTSMAMVTPAPLALSKVQVFLTNEAERIIADKVQVHKLLDYPVANRLQLTRGKFSQAPHGAADFFGSIDRTYDRTSQPIHCRLYARVRVVPFAMQQVPVLESETNYEDLIVEKHSVQCQLK